MFDLFIQYLQQFREISLTDIDLIESELLYRKVLEDEFLLEEGKKSNEIFFICKGVLKIVSSNSKEDEVTHYFLSENQFIVDLESFQDGTSASISVKSACDAEVISLSKKSLERLIGKIPYLKELVNDITQRALIEKINIRNSFLGDDAATRYEKFLKQQPDVALRVSLGSISSYLGITIQSLSRIRKNTP